MMPARILHNVKCKIYLVICPNSIQIQREENLEFRGF